MSAPGVGRATRLPIARLRVILPSATCVSCLIAATRLLNLDLRARPLSALEGTVKSDAAEQAVTTRNLIVFTVVVLLSGWIGRIVNVITGNHGPESPGILIWIVAPLATAILLRAFAGDGWGDFGLKPALKGNLKWYLIGIAVYPAVVVVIPAEASAGFPGSSAESVG